MPENFYFREPATQTMLLDILFIFCKLNQDVGYRQGMHELLAPVLWVIERDAVDRKTLDKSIDSPDDEGLMRNMLDSAYIEHDAFTMFNVIMQTAKSFYELGGQGPNPAAAPLGRSTASLNRSPIVLRSQRIHEDLLAKADPQLADWLKEIEVLPQVFLIRWIRLLFGREFPFDDVLMLWDSLFAEDSSLDVVDLVCVAMLLRIRWQLLEADYSIALTLLLRYPKPSASPSGFVKDALYLKTNLTLEGGNHIVLKYSGRGTMPQNAGLESSLPVTVGKTVDVQARPPRPSKGSNTDEPKINRTFLPLPSPARYLREQGGVEGIIRGAVGEVKKNVQFLQAGSLSHQGVSVPQPSLRNVNSVLARTYEITSRINILEERNKALAKMLEDSLKGLWDHQKVAAEDKSKVDVDALSLAIAKVQFVQVYLEDSAMPLPLPGEPLHPPTGPVRAKRATQPSDAAVPESADDITAVQPASKVSEGSKVANPDMASRAGKGSDTGPTPEAQASSSITTIPSPFHHPRPSLAQSSFSWMLGEDQRRSSFVAASPYPPEITRGSDARGKAGFLFGDDKPQHADDTGGRKGNGPDQEGFTLGSLRGIKDRS
ncbi:MAG: hypothetical protein M1830_002731 [Pleopsidium flavum]|nr:MAG: hypothetical protein M1830_002731 [Pleopsidium flavum]